MKSQESNSNWPICGQEKVLEFLRLVILRQRPAHAYIFAGQSGLGKFTVAKNFVQALICQKKDKNTAKPCQTCSDCQQLIKNFHPDVYFLKRETEEKTDKLKREISVEQVRDLKSRLTQATLLGGFKAAIIDEAQYLNVNAANALLKVLEEPTAKTVIILITNNLDSIPQTIVSRSQVLKFLPVSQTKIEKYLLAQGIKDGQNLARLCLGRPGLALALAQQPERYRQLAAAAENFFKLIKTDLAGRFTLVDSLIDWQKDETKNIEQLAALFTVWQTILRDELLLKNESDELVVNFNFLTALQNNRPLFSSARIRNLIDFFQQAIKYFRQNINPRLVLENLIINL